MERYARNWWRFNGAGAPSELPSSVTGTTNFSAANYLRTAAGAMQGAVAGFWSAFLYCVPSQAVASTQRVGACSRSLATGWWLRFDGNYSTANFQVWLADGTSVLSPTATIAASDVGRVDLCVCVMTSTQVKLYRKRAEVGLGTAMGGVNYAPATGGSEYGCIGHYTTGALPFNAGGIAYGAAYGTGVPTQAQVFAYFDAVKAARSVVAMAGVVNVSRWNATAWLDEVAARNMATTGVLGTDTATRFLTW